MSSTEFANDVLRTHNDYRAKHGVPSLKISEKLNKLAEEWAEKLALTEKMEHRPDNPYGENLYVAGSTDPKWKLKGETAVKSWYDERRLYKFGEPSPKNSGEVGHFCQLVWKGTAELGIGVAKSKAGKVYVVCNYDPPGNVLGEFGRNVLPLEPREKAAQAMEDSEEAERERIVLTASQEKMGIRFVQPNTQIVESMKRLYAVPSEKLRVWSVWLTKIEEEADEWHSWLRSHINLVLRMSEYLQKARNEIERESRVKKIINERREPSTGVERDDELYREGDEKEAEKTSGAADAGQDFKVPSEGTKNTNNREPDRFPRDNNYPERNSAMVDTTETTEEAGEGAAVSGEAGEEAPEAEPRERQPSGAKTSLKGENNGGDTNDGNREKRRNSRNGEREHEEGDAEELEKIAWPIGVPWEPAETSSTEEKEVAKKKNDEVKVIPIPGNAEEMLSLVKDVKHRATIYASFYKHWLEVADRAVKETTNRTVMPSDRVPTDEQVPYFFRLYVEPDIEIGVDNDDETILEPDRTREKITCEFTSLYFNLADKPGKGGKP